MVREYPEFIKEKERCVKQEEEHFGKFSEIAQRSRRELREVKRRWIADNKY